MHRRGEWLQDSAQFLQFVHLATGIRGPAEHTSRDQRASGRRRGSGKVQVVVSYELREASWLDAPHVRADLTAFDDVPGRTIASPIGDQHLGSTGILLVSERHRQRAGKVP